MADNFNLINFKRGTLAALQSLNTAANRSQIEEGTFYLTMEEGNDAPESARLFIGRNINGVKTIVPVNQGIIQISSVNDLSHNTQPGDFAYISDGNILCVNSDGKWIQINQAVDTYLDTFSTAVSGTDGGTKTITTSGSYHGGGVGPSTSFSVEGGEGVSISSTGTALTIDVDGYELSADSVDTTNNTATIKLQSDTDAAASPATDSGAVTLKGGANVTLSNDANDNIVITSKDIHVSAVDLSNQTQGFKVSISETEGVAKEDTIDPLISYISSVDGGTDTTTSVHFANGTATLPVYSREVIDKKLQGINALVYKGTVGTGGSASQVGVEGVSSASIGDTFMANSNFDLPASNSATGAQIAVKKGDLLIAKGTEDPTTGLITGTITYDVVPSGNDHDTTYTLTDNSGAFGVKLHPDQGVDAGEFKLAEGASGLIDLTDNWDSTNKVKTVTVEHATVTRTDPTATTDAQTATNSKVITHVTGVTTDSYGHVTGVQVQNTTVVDTNASLTAMGNTVADGSITNTTTTYATVTTSATLAPAAGVSQTQSSAFDLASDNLAVSATTGTGGANNQVKMNFVWGQF